MNIKTTLIALAVALVATVLVFGALALIGGVK